MKKLSRTFSNVLFLLKPWWKYGRLLFVLENVFNLIYCVRIFAAATIAQAIIEAAQSGLGGGHVVSVALGYVAVIIVCYVTRQARVELYFRWKRVEIDAALEREIYDQAMKTDMRYIDDPAYFDNYKIAAEEYVARSEEVFRCVIDIVGESLGVVTIIGLLAATEPAVVLIIVAGVAISAFFRGRDNIVANKVWNITTSQRRRMDYLTRLLYNKSAGADLRGTNIKAPVFDRFEQAKTERVAENKKHMWNRFLNGVLGDCAQNISGSFSNCVGNSRNGRQL